MSLQWGVIGSFLAFETCVTFLLALPFISSSSWRKLFQSDVAKIISGHASYVLTVFFVLLGVVFADAVREMIKYSHSSEDDASMANNPNAVDHVHMKLYFAQRNFLMAGFALFLCLLNVKVVGSVLANGVCYLVDLGIERRYLQFSQENSEQLISSEAKLAASEEAAIKQAKSASQTAQQLMEDQKKPAGSGEDKDVKERVAALSKSLKEAEETVKSRDADLQAIKKQAESTNREYDRLSAEYQKLQQQVEESDGKKGS